MTLRIDLLRHGIAGPSPAAGDAARALTAEGAAAVHRLGERLGLAGWRPGRAFSSPYLRARDTAAIVLGAANVPIAAGVMQELEPDCDPADTVIALGAMADGARHVLLVAHQPLLGRLATLWIGRPMSIAPGEFVGLEFDAAPAPHAGRVIAHLPPA